MGQRSRARGRKLWAVILAVVVAGVILGAVGCAGEADPTAQPSTFTSAMIGSQDFGFRMGYPSDYVRVEPRLNPSEDPGLLYRVYLVDPSGARSGDTALDVLGVSIHRITKPAAPGDVKRHRREFVTMASALVGEPDHLTVTEPFRVTTLAGHQALTGSYAYRIDGADVAVVAYLVPVEDRAYWITGQASRQTWDTAGRELGSAIATLQLSGGE